jgi:hypothetical protein
LESVKGRDMGNGVKHSGFIEHAYIIGKGEKLGILRAALKELGLG